MAVIPSATTIKQLKRMTAATVNPVIADEDISDALVMYALADGNGLVPSDLLWTETYDMNGAAAEVWGWKEAAASAWVTANADGSLLSLGQIVANCQAQKLYYQNQRAWGTITVTGSGS